jgi:multidrug efflux pump subunit AcrA (membrane-fusion protein)
MNKEAGDARRDAGLAIERAGKAEEHLGNARQAAAIAEQHAADANAKAEGFRLSIAKANESAAQAQAQVANATAEAAKANLELARLKLPRSLSRVPELVAELGAFKATEYTFVSVFQDEDSLYLLRAIDDLLQKAGWKRDTPPRGFPAINIYGNDPNNFAVTVGFNTGIQISVDVPDAASTIESLPIDNLPPLVKAAVALDVWLSSSLSPPQAEDDRKKVNVEKGTSPAIRIAVGKKP